MTILIPMRPEAWPGYRERSIAGLAQDNTRLDIWSEASALENARDELDSLLPQGLATPNHYLYEIGSDVGSIVGWIWFEMIESDGKRRAFVNDIEINAEYRRQGHATRAFSAMESLLLELGAVSVGLNVFGHNAGAQALYERLGYRVTQSDMGKRLEPAKIAARSL